MAFSLKKLFGFGGGDKYAQVSDDYKIAEGGWTTKAGQYLEGIKAPELGLTEAEKTRMRGVGREKIGKEAAAMYQKMSSPLFSKTSAGRAQMANVIGQTKANAAYNEGLTELAIADEQMKRAQQMFGNQASLAELRQRQAGLGQQLAGGVANIGMAGRQAAENKSAGLWGLAGTAAGSLFGSFGLPNVSKPKVPPYGTGTGSGTAVDSSYVSKVKLYGRGTDDKMFIAGDDPTGQGRENRELIVRDGKETHVIPMNSGSRYVPVLMMTGSVDSPMVRGGKQRGMFESMTRNWRPNRNEVTRGRRDDE